MPISPNQSASLMQPDSATGRVSWRWHERLVLFCVGLGIGGFLFCAILSWYLFPRRPVLPEPALGYTHFFEIKHHGHYGTHFEYLAVTYGALVTWGFAALSGMFIYVLGINNKSRTYRRQILAAAVISMPIYVAIWWAFL
jgi:hypothetical protein